MGKSALLPSVSTVFSQVGTDEATTMKGVPKREMFIAGLNREQLSWDESFSHTKMHSMPIKVLAKDDSF